MICVKTEELLKLYKKCLEVDYDTKGDDVQYRIERIEDDLIIYFQCTTSKVDWLNNFRFWKKPYKDMPIKWKCHAGFLKCWKQVEDSIGEAIKDETIRGITIIGFSHGAALATLCYEYCWFNKPCIRDNIIGFGFGTPRVVGMWRIPKRLKVRWENFYIFKNNKDIVTSLPPRWLKFTHVNKHIKIGYGKCGRIKSHRYFSYIDTLERMIKEEKTIICLFNKR